MKNNILKKSLITLAVLVFWIGVWYISALIIDSRILLPTPIDTLEALFELLSKGEFYLSLLLTLLRVISGLILGIFLGISLAIATYKVPALYTLIKPFISVIRATPVASFIVLLWVLLSGNVLSVVIAVLMVMPIVWQNTFDGFASVPKELKEVLEIYPVSFKRRFKVLYMPILSGYIYPAVIMSVGLAWKSEIAAEIIAYTKNSIGMYINDAKSFALTPSVFALTAVVIILSLSLEFLTKRMLRGVRK